MRILVATNLGGLDDMISPVFARCQTFTLVETDGKEIKNVEVIPNQFMNAVHGAGIQVGQYLISQGINVAIAGNFGPNVSSILMQSGIETISAQGKVRDVIEKYLNGEISQQTGAPVAPPPTAPPPAYPPYQPPYQPYQPYQSSHSLQSQDIDERLKMLEEQIAKLEDMVNGIKKKIEELKGE